MGLIKKTSLESKKPAYQWIGLQGLDVFIAQLHSSQNDSELAQENKKRIFSDDLFKGEIKGSSSLQFSAQRNLFNDKNIPSENSEEEISPNKNANKEQFMENFFIMLLQFYKLELRNQAEAMPSMDDLSMEALRIKDNANSSDKSSNGSYIPSFPVIYNLCYFFVNRNRV